MQVRERFQLDSWYILRSKKIGTRGKQTARLYISGVLEQLRNHDLKLYFIGASFFNIVINVIHAANILTEKQNFFFLRIKCFLLQALLTLRESSGQYDKRGRVLSPAAIASNECDSPLKPWNLQPGTCWGCKRHPPKHIGWLRKTHPTMPNSFRISKQHTPLRLVSYFPVNPIYIFS